MEKHVSKNIWTAQISLSSLEKKRVINGWGRGSGSGRAGGYKHDQNMYETQNSQRTNKIIK